MKNKAFFAVLLLAAAACNPPKYASYQSVAKDFSAKVPWGWQVMTDFQDTDYAQTVFIGPFDPDFYLGAPSLSVRWYRRYRAHRLPDGRLEMYSGADDFVAQTLSQVYGPDYVLMSLDGKLSYKKTGETTAEEVIPEITLLSSGLKAKAFIVESATPAPEANRWGISEQAGTGKPFVLRKHSYAVVPVADGFYVLTYPATERGHENFVDKFAGLIGSFMPHTAGPAGERVRVPGPVAARK
ncbi:MAG: hypothetical protein M0D55_18075 [Elusimicrobiota bacterium]|nr:MAG: hypothetical protein M0D55_18075 [Elusimicrobiota bacterium]